MIDYGASIVKRHVILLNGVGSSMQNCPTKIGDIKENKQGSMFGYIWQKETGGLNQEEIKMLRSLISNFDKSSST